jgi:hypothetical protein
VRRQSGAGAGAGGPSRARRAGLRAGWPPGPVHVGGAGAAVWMAGRELSAVESSFVVAGECTFNISWVCVKLQG